MILKKLQKTILRDVLSEIYFHSGFIGSIDEICEKINSDKVPVVHPIGAYKDERIIGFFTIEFSNPPVKYKTDDPGSCWLGSFFISEKFQKKGYAKDILKALPRFLKKEYTFLERINLTVNVRNRKAKPLYLRCGFQDTGELFSEGPFGPQHIFTKNLNYEGFDERDR